MLDETLLHEVRRVLTASGVTECEAFVLVELNDGGLRTSVVDAGSGVSVIERGDGKLRPRMLDLAMADHLVRVGRVERPSSFDWATELIDLMPDVRSRLAVTDGAFAMGRDHVAMFRVSRRDYHAGLQPHLQAAQSLWQAVALDAAPTVGALVFMPEHEQWPGLYPTLSHLASIPAVALSETGLRETALSDTVLGESAESGSAESGSAESGSVAAEPVTSESVGAARPDTSVEAVNLSALPELAAAPDTPVPDTPLPVSVEIDSTGADSAEVDSAASDSVPNDSTANDSAGSDSATPVFDGAVFDTAVYGQRLVAPAMPPVAAEVPIPAAIPAASPVQSAPVQSSLVPSSPGSLAPVPTASFLPVPPTQTQALFRSTGEQDVYMPLEFIERTPISVHDHRDVNRSAGPRHYTPPAAAPRGSGDDGRMHRRRVLIGVTAVAAAVVAGGLIIVLPWMGAGDTERASTPSPQGVARTSSVPSSTPPTSRPPLDTRGAQTPLLQYTPPPPAAAAAQGAQPSAPKRRIPAQPRRRSIPNPIPGLPPILLP